MLKCLLQLGVKVKACVTSVIIVMKLTHKVLPRKTITKEGEVTSRLESRSRKYDSLNPLDQRLSLAVEQKQAAARATLEELAMFAVSTSNANKVQACEDGATRNFRDNDPNQIDSHESDLVMGNATDAIEGVGSESTQSQELETNNPPFISPAADFGGALEVWGESFVGVWTHGTRVYGFANRSGSVPFS
jgi:hypothetical protein